MKATDLIEQLKELIERSGNPDIQVKIPIDEAACEYDNEIEYAIIKSGESFISLEHSS